MKWLCLFSLLLSSLPISAIQIPPNYILSQWTFLLRGGNISVTVDIGKFLSQQKIELGKFK